MVEVTDNIVLKPHIEISPLNPSLERPLTDPSTNPLSMKLSLVRHDAKNIPAEKEKSLSQFELTTDKAAKMLDTSLQLWQSNFDWNDFKEKLNAPTTPENTHYFKQIRKYGLMINSSYILLDKSGTVPPEHFQFIRLLGKLNDYVYEDNGEQYKHKIEEILNTSYSPEYSYKTEYPDDTTLKNQWNNTISHIEDLIQPTVIKADDFHKVRINVRHYLNMVQLSLMVEENHNSLLLLKNLLQLNDRMGQIHGPVQKEEDRGSINYAAYLIEVPEELRTQIVSTLGYLKQK